MRAAAAGGRRRAVRGFSFLEGLVTALALAVVVALVLRVFARGTRVAGPEDAAQKGRLALESAFLSLHRALRDAGSGPVPLSPLAVVPVLDDAPEGTTFRDASGREVAVVAGTDALSVRGLLDQSAVALDPVERATGEPFARPAGTGPPGLLQREPARARLVIYRYPSRFNPRRNWIAGAPGLGRKWGSGAGAWAGRTNESLDVLASGLAPAGAGERLLAISDEEGLSAVARVIAVDASRRDEGCGCEAPAPWPGDCPPGESGCFLVLTLDFTDARAVAWNRGRDPSAVSRLGRLAWGAPLAEETYFVARDAAAPAGSFLAAGRLAGPDRLEVRRAAEGISDLQVAFGLAEDAFAPFLAAESPVPAPSIASPAKGADRWWPNVRGEPLPSPRDLVDAAGAPRLRLVRVTVRSASGGSASGTFAVAPRALLPEGEP